MGQRRLGKRLAIVLAAAGLSMVPAPWAGASGPSTPAGDTAAGAADDEFAGLVDIGGGRRLYLECRGSGSPTVVFESGSGDAADVWSLVEEGSSETAVLPAVAEFTRVCAYDRPGTVLRSAQPSRSDPVDLPRAVSEIVADLHALLDAADVPGPYVLVAHSMGGLLARLYAGTYPDEVAGFISVDAAHEIYYEAYQELLPPELYMAPGAEIDVVAAAADMRRARTEQPLRQMPMVVLEHSRDRERFPNPFGLPPGLPIEALELAFQASQDDLASLVPGTQHVIAANSEHYIHFSEPALVVDATRAVVEAVRRGESRLGSEALADTGGTAWILVSMAFLLTGLGLGLRVVSTAPNSTHEQNPG